MQLKITIIFCLILISFKTNADSYDSVKYYYQKSTSNPEYLHNLYHHTFQVHRKSPDTTIKYALLGIEICKQEKDSVELAYFYKTIGIAFSVKGDYQKALDFTAKAYNLCSITSIEPNFKPSVLTSMGIIYEYLGRYNDAVECQTQAVEEYKKNGYPKGVATSLNNLAIVNLTLEKNYDLALKYFHESLEIREQINDIPKIASSLNNIGEIYISMGEMSKAIEYINRATQLYLELNDNYGLAVNYLNLANFYYEQKNYIKAKEYSHKSIVYADSLDLKFPLQKNYKLLSDINKAQGDFKKAYTNYVLYSELKDSTINEKNLKKIRELDTKYKIDKTKKDILIANKEKQLKEIELKKQKNSRIALLVIIILALIILLLVFNRASQKIMSKE